MKKSRGRQKLDKNIKIKIKRGRSKKKLPTNGNIFYNTSQNIDMEIKENETQSDILCNKITKIDEAPNLKNNSSLDSNRNLLNKSNYKKMKNQFKANESNNLFIENNKSNEETTVLSNNNPIEITKHKIPSNLCDNNFTIEKYILDNSKKAKQPNIKINHIPAIYNSNINENLLNDQILKRKKMLNITKKRKLIIENTKIEDGDVAVATTNALKRRKI